MKRILIPSLLFLSLALAASSTLRVVLNGQPSGMTTATVNGQTYIPLAVLQKMNIPYTVQGGTLSIGTAQSVTAGGSNQRTSLEGCLNEYLFDGVWRIKATKLERIVKEGDALAPGWGLTLELRNGTKTNLSTSQAGMNGTLNQLIFADANALDVDPYDLQAIEGDLTQGGVVTHQLKFYYPYGTTTSAIKIPVKFLLEVDPKAMADDLKGKVAFSSANPSFRVRLDCTK